VDDGNNRPGTKAVYTCNKGYKLDGDETRLCLYDGTWEGKAPTCKLIRCPYLKAPDYGSVDDGDNRPGTKAVYDCDKGFKLVGDRRRLCLYDGTWKGKAPTCKRIIILCPKLKDPRYGDVDVNGKKPGSVAKYSCKKGFKLVGVDWRKCQYNGYWTGEAPVCKVIICKRPPKPAYGYVKYKRTYYGSRAYYSCYKGYYLVGKRYTYCNNLGEWHGSTPSCRRHYYH
jgi:CUB/sushi domain-containing protein